MERKERKGKGSKVFLSIPEFERKETKIIFLCVPELEGKEMKTKNGQLYICQRSNDFFPVMLYVNIGGSLVIIGIFFLSLILFSPNLSNLGGRLGEKKML